MLGCLDDDVALVASPVVSILDDLLLAARLAAVRGVRDLVRLDERDRALEVEVVGLVWRRRRTERIEVSS